MNRWKRTVGIIAAVALFTTATAVADDWPQWRGPNRDGISKETGLLRQWPAEGPKLLWQVKDAGAGFSTPAVVGERLYSLGNRGLEEEFVAAKNVSEVRRKRMRARSPAPGGGATERARLRFLAG